MKSQMPLVKTWEGAKVNGSLSQETCLIDDMQTFRREKLKRLRVSVYIRAHLASTKPLLFVLSEGFSFF